LFAALGRFSYRFRWYVVVVWTAIFIAGLAGVSLLPDLLKGSAYVAPDTPSQATALAMQQRIGSGISQVTIVFASATLTADSPSFKRLVEQALAGYTKLAFPYLNTIKTTYNTGDTTMISGDGKATVAWLVFDIPMDQLQPHLEQIKAALHATVLKTYFTGEPFVYRDLETIAASELRSVEAFAFPIALFVLLLVYGTFFAAALPIVGGGTAVAGTMGVLALVAPHYDLSTMIISIVALLGIAEGVNYSLIMVNRFRQELAHGESVPAAVETTVRRAGRTIFVSGAAVVISLVGLTTFRYLSLRSIGIGGVLVVLFSMLVALTLLPALLGILGGRVNSWRLLWRPSREGRRWTAWSAWVARHSAAVLVVSAALVVFVAWPVIGIKLGVPSASSLPSQAESRQGDQIIRQRFDAGALNPIQVFVTWSGGNTDPFANENLKRLYGYVQALAKLPGAGVITSIVSLPIPGADLSMYENFWPVMTTGRLPPGGGVPGAFTPAFILSQATPERRAVSMLLKRSTTAPGAVLIRVAPTADPASASARQLAASILKLTPPPGMYVRTTGVTEGMRDYLAAMTSRFPWVVVFACCATFVALAFFLRSFVLPLQAVGAAACSLLAGFGAMVWVFQYGHMEWLFGFRSLGVVDVDLLVVMFCIIFGVSMDYEVLLLTRIREAWTVSGDNRASVELGLATNGRVIGSAATIVVIVAATFAFTSVMITKSIGVGLAVGVAFDAFVVRMALTPATLRLLGRANWWLPSASREDDVPRLGEA
jgi:putative drug exporter of the RND superfamily